jgi:hypothetical protein
MRLKTAVTPSRAGAADLAFVAAGQLGKAGIGEAHHLQRRRPSAVTGRPSLRICASVSTISRMRARNQGSKAVIWLDLVVGQPVAHGLRDDAQPVGGLPATAP